MPSGDEPTMNGGRKTLQPRFPALPKETETNKTSSGSDGAVDVSAVTNNDNLMDSLDQQTTAGTDDSPKLEQYLLDSIAAAVTSSSTSVTPTIGYQNFGGNGGTSQGSQITNDAPEMPQLMSILNELLDGQDLSSLANTGGNGDNMQDMVDQEENYEDESPRKDDPEELTRLLVQQRLGEISREQQQVQRKMDFLIRRLYKLVARATGLHASEEIAGFLEHVARHTRKDQLNDSKFPSLTTNLQGTSMLSPLTPSSEPPINLLSSPSASQEETQSINLTDVIKRSPAETLKPVPVNEMKSFLRRLENTSTMQSTTLNKRAHTMKYFTRPVPNGLSNLSKMEISLMNNTINRFESRNVEQLDQVSGLLMSEMRMIEKQIDSDATASSSGGESADEMVTYNNHHQQPLSISKRAAYKFAKDRGAVASRWCWLATQISELDYKIRQHTDLRKHIKDNKGVVTLEEVAGFEGQLPGSSSCVFNVDDGNEEANDGTAARVRPFNKSSFRKRKLVQTSNLHLQSKKAGRPSTLKCGCQWPLQPCALCTGRLDPTAPRDLPDTLPTTERVALLDPGFHPVLSFPDDVSNNIHLEAIMNIPEWQSKMIRTSPKSIMKHANKQLELLGAIGGDNGSFKDTVKTHHTIDEKKLRKGNIDLLTGKRKYTKKLMKLDLSNKIKERKKHRKRGGSLTIGPGSPHVPRKYTFKKRLRKLHNEGLSNNYHPNVPNGLNGGHEKHLESFNRSKNSSPVPHHRSEKKQSESRSSRNYDIDNIVIPYSVAASTRVEVLSYKEIPTPTWRVITEDDEHEQLSVEQEQCNQSGECPDKEDISDECIVQKHEKALQEERKKFSESLKFPFTTRSRANRRIDSRGNESSGANTPTPDPTSPAPVILTGDLESIPSPLGSSDLHEVPSITAMLNNINGRKERNRTVSKKEEGHEGMASGTASRCSSPEPIKETIPAYEPLHFPLTELSLQRMKRSMPNNEHSKQSGRYFSVASLRNSETQAASHQASLSKRSRPLKKCKTKDSISESKLIKEKLPSSALATIGKSNNVLIPRNNHNYLDSIDLTATDGAVLKQLMNNNNGDLSMNGEGFGDEEDDEDEDLDMDSDSETITGDESLFGVEDVDSDSDDYTIENDRKLSLKKRNSYVPKARMV